MYSSLKKLIKSEVSDLPYHKYIVKSSDELDVINLLNEISQGVFKLKKIDPKDKIINKLELVSRQEFEVLKKIVQKQDAIIKKLMKTKKTKKVKKS